MILALVAALAAAPVSADYLGPETRQATFECPPQTRFPGPQGRTPVLSPTLARWYAEAWAAADEPSLYARSLERAPPRTWRFTWLRSFHEPVFVRVEEDPRGRMRLVAKRLSGPGGFRLGAVTAKVERTLSADEARALEALLAKHDPMTLTPGDCGLAADGAQWIVEEAAAGRYRLIHRQSPAKDPVRELGDAFLALTGWTFADRY